MDKRYELADKHGMSHEFIDWFFDKKKDGSGDLWFVMMSAMWEGYKARGAASPLSSRLAVNRLWMLSTDRVSKWARTKRS